MVSTEDIHTITSSVCTMMLDVDIEPAEAFELTHRDDHITGCVQISGTWNGVVMLRTTNAFVSRAACKMLALDEAELELSDRQDTIAELTNMIGGNIKSLVPGPSFLSLPSVTIGKEFDIRVYGTVSETEVPVRCFGEQLCIQVYRALKQDAFNSVG